MIEKHCTHHILIVWLLLQTSKTTNILQDALLSFIAETRRQIILLFCYNFIKYFAHSHNVMVEIVCLCFGIPCIKNNLLFYYLGFKWKKLYIYMYIFCAKIILIWIYFLDKLLILMLIACKYFSSVKCQS